MFMRLACQRQAAFFKAPDCKTAFSLVGIARSLITRANILSYR